MGFCFVLFRFVFETGSYYIALAILELAYAEQTNLRFTEISLLLLSKCWD